MKLLEQKKFPSKSKVKPKQVKEAIDDYATSIKTLKECCDEVNISVNNFYRLMKQFPQILDEYEKAQAIKAHILTEETQQIADNESDDFYKMGDKKVPNPTKVKRDQLRINTRQRLAAIYNSRYADKKQVDQRSVSLNANVDLPSSEEELKGMDTEEILKLFK